MTAFFNFDGKIIMGDIPQKNKTCFFKNDAAAEAAIFAACPH